MANFFRYDLGPRGPSTPDPNPETAEPVRSSRRPPRFASLDAVSDEGALDKGLDHGNFRSTTMHGDGKYRIVSASDVPRPEERYWYSNNGFVLMTAPNGQSYRSSGCLITPRLVVTAGHCVYSEEDGGIATQASFWPNYPFSKDPFSAKRIYVMPRWAAESDYRQDIALIYLDKPIETRGLHGVVINVSYDAENHYGWTTIGYPGTMPGIPNCHDMVLDGGPRSKRAFRRGNLYWRNGIVAMDRFDLNPGSSGGPWVLNNSGSPLGKIILPGVRGGRLFTPLINSVTSFTFSDKPDNGYGPELKDVHGDFLLATIADTAIDP